MSWSGAQATARLTRFSSDYQPMNLLTRLPSLLPGLKELECSRQLPRHVPQFLQDARVVLTELGDETYSLRLALTGITTGGLEQLEALSRLESFRVAELSHRVGETEMAWMRGHWSRLRMFELPVFGALGAVDQKAALVYALKRGGRNAGF
ncbi:MAG: hypothetical protein BYD32DRAFT_467167 [Podila humilis]|nr:MAG: hypothetical protein BYD32DRAFT_467167 [Podila humilis]